MGEDSLQLFGGDWTEQKLDAVGRYLDAYAKALSRTAFNRIYIDAFAGTGYREQKASIADQQLTMFADDLAALASPESQRFLDGSAKIALRVDPPFHRFIFIEHDRSKVLELEKLKTEFPAHASAIDIRREEANSAIRSICNAWDQGNSRGVLFLDPFGMQVEWKTIEAVASTGCIDTWILFPFAANRLMTQSPERILRGWRARLDTLFGTPDWQSRFYKQRNDPKMFEGDIPVMEKDLTFHGLGTFYGERLRSVFPVVAPNPRILRTTDNRPLFQLFFAAANKGKGGQIALKIAKHILDKI